MKSLEEIKADMDLTQAKYTALNPLASNTSEVALYGTLKNMFAVLFQLILAEWDAFRVTVEIEIADTRVGLPEWYADQVKAFQYGDPVSVVKGRVTYDVIDESKRIIVQSCVVEDQVTGRLSIKAIKDNSAVLEPDELTALKGYVGRFKYAGVLCDVSSIEADDVKIVCTVKVDKQVIGLNGLSLSDPSKAPVWDAIAAYLRLLPVTSMITNSEIVDAVQAVKGVKDFAISTSSTKRPVSGTWNTYDREVLSIAGHAKLHADSSFTYVN